MNSRILGQDVAIVYEQLKMLEPIVGTFEGKMKLGDLAVTIMQETKWAEDKSCITFKEVYTLSAEDAKAANLPGSRFILTGVIGWDASRQKIKTVWFGSWGYTCTAYYSVDGNCLRGERDLVFPTGQTNPGTMTWIIKSADEQVWEETNRVTGEDSRTEWTRIRQN